MKHSNFIKTAAKSAICAMLFYTSAAHAQIRQYYIGTAAKSEIAVAVRAMPDGSSIIAGYTYDIASGGVVTDADMLLLKVQNGVILWQRQWGTPNDDLIQDMTITQNGDIIVVGTVGRTAPAAGNTAAIFRFDQTGTMLQQNYVHDNNPSDLGGEIFFGVCELGNGNIVAVGDRDNRPDYGDALVSTFNPSLTLINNDVYEVDGVNYISDLFAGAVPDPNNPNSVYLCGYKYNSSEGTHDARIAYYTPAVAPGPPGTLVWDYRYDFTYGTMTNNILSKIVAVNNSQLVIEGWISTDCCAGDDLKQIIFRTDTSAMVGDVKVFLNSKTYANSFSYFPVSYDETYITEIPSDTAFDPTYTGSTVVLNGVVSHINSLSGEAIDYSRQFALPGYHSLLDLVSANSMLYMAGGVSDDSEVFGGKDIYYVESSPNLKPGGKNACLLTNDVLAIDSVSTVKVPLTDFKYSIPPYAMSPLTTIDPGMDIKLICGVEPPVDSTKCNFTETKLIVTSDGTDQSGNCLFTAVAFGHTTSNIVGYQWTVTGQPTIVHHTTGLSDTFNFTVPAGTLDSVSVLVDAVNPNYPAGGTPCCQSTLETRAASCMENNGRHSAPVNSANGTQNTINLYPNPTKESVTVSSSDVNITDIQVVDVYGKVLHTYTYNGLKQTTISLKGYVPGTYFIKVNNNYSQIVNKLD